MALDVKGILFATDTNKSGTNPSFEINETLADDFYSNHFHIEGTFSGANTLANAAGGMVKMQSSNTNPAAPEQSALVGMITAGGTSVGDYIAGNFDNSALGTGQVTSFVGTGGTGMRANFGSYSQSNGASVTGDNVGAWGRSFNARQNFGVIGVATKSDDKVNIGVAGAGYGDGTGMRIGGLFQLGATINALEACALLADNGNTTDRIFRARDNGTTVFSIKDGGILNSTTMPTSSAGLASGDIYSNLGVLTIVP